MPESTKLDIHVSLYTVARLGKNPEKTAAFILENRMNKEKLEKAGFSQPVFLSKRFINPRGVYKPTSEKEVHDVQDSAGRESA